MARCGCVPRLGPCGALRWYARGPKRRALYLKAGSGIRVSFGGSRPSGKDCCRKEDLRLLMLPEQGDAGLKRPFIRAGRIFHVVLGSEKKLNALAVDRHDPVHLPA